MRADLALNPLVNREVVLVDAGPLGLCKSGQVVSCERPTWKGAGAHTVHVGRVKAELLDQLRGHCHPVLLVGLNGLPVKAGEGQQGGG